MPKAMHAPRNRQTMATTVTRSWLRAVGLQSDTSAVPGFHLDLLTADAGLLHVAIVDSLEQAPGAPDGAEAMSVLAEEIGSYDTAKAMAAFHAITEAAGWGRPVPVDRGRTPTRSEVYGQDFFLQAARHREFRSAPDLSPEQIAVYGRVVKRAASRFLARNSSLCAAHGYDLDDLISYAWIYCHEFAHRYEVAPGSEDNLRLLTKYLRNRFTEFRGLLKRAAPNTMPDAETAQIALAGRVFDAGDNTSPFSVDPRKALEGSERLQEIVDRDDADTVALRRRAAARSQLKKFFGTLSHEEMLSKLRAVAESESQAWSTRKEARRQMIMHAKTCARCQETGLSLKPLTGGDSEEVNVRGREHKAGADPAGLTEDV